MASGARERRAYLASALLLSGGIVWFQARGLSALLGQALAPAVPPAPASAPSATSELPPRSRSAAAILARQPFDSAAASSSVSASASAPPLAAPHHPLDVPLCEGLTLSLVTEEPDARDSTALLAPADGPGKRLRPGERLGEHTLVYAGYNPRLGTPAAWLERGGELCQLLLFGGGVGVHAPPPEPRPAPSAAPVAPLAIRSVSEGVVALDRGAVEGLLARTEELAPKERYLLERSGDEVVGMRLFGVTADGLLGQLGLRSGDRLESVGGVPVESRERVLEGYSGLRTSGSVVLRVTRKGAPMELTIEVR